MNGVPVQKNVEMVLRHEQEDAPLHLHILTEEAVKETQQNRFNVMKKNVKVLSFQFTLSLNIFGKTGLGETEQKKMIYTNKK